MAFTKSRDAANESTKSNRRVKFAFYNTVNSRMNNYSISPKKKFSILLKLMKNNKFSPTPPLLENNVTINEPQEKSELFNTFFASKSNVQGANDDPPILQRLVNVPNLDNINTSPLEIKEIPFIPLGYFRQIFTTNISANFTFTLKTI